MITSKKTSVNTSKSSVDLSQKTKTDSVNTPNANISKATLHCHVNSQSNRPTVFRSVLSSLVQPNQNLQPKSSAAVFRPSAAAHRKGRSGSNIRRRQERLRQTSAAAASTKSDTTQRKTHMHAACTAHANRTQLHTCCIQVACKLHATAHFLHTSRTLVTTNIT